MNLDQIYIPPNCQIIKEKEVFTPLSDHEIREKLLHLTDKITQRTLVVINDAHRSTPSARILKLLAELPHTIEGIIIATGTHAPPTENELKGLLKGIDKKLNVPVFIHDCHGDTEYLGTTTRHTEVHINPIINNYPHILTINSVEPHFFAGYTGGVKSIIPGLAKHETVVKNHSWSLDENSGPTQVYDNPLQQDLWEGFDFVLNRGIEVSTIQLVSSADEIGFVSAGSMKKAFDEAVEAAEQVYVHKIKEPVDVLVSFVFPPLNRSLYQAQKGIENTRAVLKSGGSMILVAQCPEGLGNDLFYQTMTKYTTPDEVISSLSRDQYNFGDHKAMKFATLARDHSFFLVSDLSSKRTQQVFGQRLSMYELEDELRKASGLGKSILIVLDGAMNTLVLA
ncbi:MAG: DUF2088 domain-containing protein [Candidatus Heimdallarchaeota archaeon]|nr:DUF2088 domain-containing protein [Candidatus Heimdallarchaeota archaeon]